MRKFKFPFDTRLSKSHKHAHRASKRDIVCLALFCLRTQWSFLWGTRPSYVSIEGNVLFLRKADGLCLKKKVWINKSLKQVKINIKVEFPH